MKVLSNIVFAITLLLSTVVLAQETEVQPETEEVQPQDIYPHECDGVEVPCDYGFPSYASSYSETGYDYAPEPLSKKEKAFNTAFLLIVILNFL